MIREEGSILKLPTTVFQVVSRRQNSNVARGQPLTAARQRAKARPTRGQQRTPPAGSSREHRARAKMPYAAHSAPTADEAHYDENRVLAWQREQQIRKDAARRRKQRAQSNDQRQRTERERGENEYAERKMKKQEYVRYLRSQFTSRKRRSEKRKKAEPTQYEIDRRRAGPGGNQT